MCLLFLRFAQVRGLADATKSSGQGRGRTADLPLFSCNRRPRRGTSPQGRRLPTCASGRAGCRRCRHCCRQVRCCDGLPPRTVAAWPARWKQLGQNYASRVKRCTSMFVEASGAIQLTVPRAVSGIAPRPGSSKLVVSTCVSRSSEFVPTEAARANQELTHTVSSSAQLSGPSRGQSSVLLNSLPGP
jgi:hypothetical protein